MQISVLFVAVNCNAKIMFQKLNLRVFISIVLGLMLSNLLIACSDESSSNSSESEDRPTLTTDENGNVSEVNCGPGDQIFIDGVDVCAG